jgi:hypothetical protein
MASRVRDFSREHPNDSAQYVKALSTLEQLLARATTLVAQERAGHLRVRSAVVRRAELRREIHQRHLVHLAHIAEAASAQAPELVERFRLPKTRTNHRTFLGAVQDMAAEAAVHRDVFVAYGLPATFLEDLNTALAEYEKVVTERHAGTQTHVGARADLRSVTEEIMLAIQDLDAINRYRYQNSPELLAAWESARNIAWPVAGDQAPPPSAPPVAPAA